ncbi:MAG: hypothetical protein ACREQQ_11750, partial [Candidatus Binatia bacterium]
MLRAEGGPEALAAFRRLPEAAQRDVLLFGDRLAEASLALAHAYALQAPRARRRLDRDRFVAWAERAIEIGDARLGNRDAAVAYLRLDPATLLGSGEKLLDRWMSLCGEIQAVSRKLTVLFLEGSGPVLPVLGERGFGRLEAWARGGLRLASGSGWRGEFLAAAFFGAGAEVLPVLTAAEIGEWVELGIAVQSGREVFQGYFQALPSGFASLSSAERSALFALCLAAAREAPRSVTLFLALPDVLANLAPPVRLPLLHCLGPAAAHHEAVAAALPLLGAIAGSIPPPQRVELLARIAETAKRLPACAVPLLRSLPRAREQAGKRGIRRWLARGEAIAAENPEAGRAYFALESRTALRVLREDSAAVALEEVEPVLRSFARMLSGETFTLRGA